MDESFDYIKRVVPATETTFLVPAATGSTFVGPGDIVAGALAWYGLRAYSGAKAGSNCVDVQRASDNATQTFKTLVADGSLDVASLATFLTATTGTVTKLYDQTGNGFDLAPGQAPAIQLSVLGSLPGIVIAAGNNLVSAGSISQAQPYTFSVVGNRTGNFNTRAGLLSGFTMGVFGGYAGANQIWMYAGTIATASGAGTQDSTTHAWIAVFNGASSVLGGDDNPNTVDANTSALAGTVSLATETFDGAVWIGNFFEGGIWGTAFNSTQQTNMNNNQHTYWGF